MDEVLEERGAAYTRQLALVTVLGSEVSPGRPKLLVSKMPPIVADSLCLRQLFLQDELENGKLLTRRQLAGATDVGLNQPPIKTQFTMFRGRNRGNRAVIVQFFPFT